MLDTGSKEWIWTWSQQNNGRSAEPLGLHHWNETILFDSWHDVYAINAGTGSTNWQYLASPNCGSPRSVQIGSYLYDMYETCGNVNDFSTLAKIDINTGMVEDICTLHKEDGYSPTIESVALWVNPQGDSILVFQNRSLNWDTVDVRIDLHAYNMTRDTMEWEIPNIDADGNSSVWTPLIWDNKIYFKGARTVYCIDAVTHHILWSKRLPHDCLFTNLLMAEGKLIVKPDNDLIMALDPHTGAEIWWHKNSGETCNPMVYHDGLLYYTSKGNGKIYAIRASNGEQIWADEPPNHYIDSDAGFYGGIAIDTVKNVLYTTDSFFALCIKLPEH